MHLPCCRTTVPQPATRSHFHRRTSARVRPGPCAPGPTSLSVATSALVSVLKRCRVASLVLSGFLRIVTHRRVFRTPSPLVDAIEFLDVVAGAPQAAPITPGPRHWDIFTELCLDARATGNLIPDAYLAAIAIESGCEFVTTERDFTRFPGLTWTDPLAR